MSLEPPDIADDADADADDADDADDDALESAAPDHLRCRITHQLMRQPAVTPFGVSYERDAIVAWVERRGVDPQTRRRLAPSDLAPNLALRAAVEDYVGEYWRERAGRRPEAEAGRGDSL